MYGIDCGFDFEPLFLAPEQMTSLILLPPQTLLETVSGCFKPMKQVWKLGDVTQKVQIVNTSIV